MCFPACLAASLLAIAPTGTHKQRDKLLIVFCVFWVGWQSKFHSVNVKWRYAVVIKPSRYNLIPENPVGKTPGTLGQAKFVIWPQTKLAGLCDWSKQKPFGVATWTYANISLFGLNVTDNRCRKEVYRRQWNLWFENREKHTWQLIMGAYGLRWEEQQESWINDYAKFISCFNGNTKTNII